MSALTKADRRELYRVLTEFLKTNQKDESARRLQKRLAQDIGLFPTLTCKVVYDLRESDGILHIRTRAGDFTPEMAQELLDKFLERKEVKGTWELHPAPRTSDDKVYWTYNAWRRETASSGDPMLELAKKMKKHLTPEQIAEIFDNKG